MIYVSTCAPLNNTSNTCIPIDGIKGFDLVHLVGEERVQMFLPLESCDAMAHKGLHVLLDIRKQDINASQCSFCENVVSTQYSDLLV